MSNRVWVVGSINEDTRLSVTEHARSGQTISARLDGSDLGGKGANQAVAAARAGIETRFVGAVGDDTAGRRLRALLSHDGIDTARIHVSTVEATGTAYVVLDQHSDNLILVVAGANASLDEHHVSEALVGARTGDVVVAQLETSPQSVQAALRTGKAAGSRTLLNAAPFRADAVELLADVDLLVVNEHELEDIAEALAVQSALSRPSIAQTIAHGFDLTLICTLGAEGSFAATSDQIDRVPSEKVAAIDTTAAGDTYIGYLAASLAAGNQLVAAMQTATRASAIAVTRAGASSSIPTAADVRNACA